MGVRKGKTIGQATLSLKHLALSRGRGGKLLRIQILPETLIQNQKAYKNTNPR